MPKQIKKKHQHHHPVDEVATIILAGGEGSRLFPLTVNRCKPAVSFGGRYRLIDIPISNSLNSGIPHIFVIGQYLASSLNNHIKDTFQLDQIQGGWIELLHPEERHGEKAWYKGTADSVRKNLSYFQETPCEYFLILSGDQLYNMDLEELIEFAKEKDADLTIATIPVEKSVASRMGIMNIDDKQNIVDFVEKPQDPEVLSKYQLDEKYQTKLQLEGEHFLASMGIYVFKRDALFSLLNEDPREDFGKHLISTQMKKSGAAAYIYNGYWEDIGTVGSYYRANLSLTRHQLGLDLYDESNPIIAKRCHLPCASISKTQISHSIICQGSIVHAKEVTNSIIGMRSNIKKGTVITDSLVIGHQFYIPPDRMKEDHPDELSIGENCTIRKTIIDENCSIGNNVQLVNASNLNEYDGKGVYIRDGIIIVSGGTHLPDGFTL
jgi:glucose-1-phosphate adenylyltransferase